jgi:hypothetical protein
MHRLGLNDDLALTAGIAIKPIGNDKRRKRSRDSDGDDRSQIGAARREIGGTAARRDKSTKNVWSSPSYGDMVNAFASRDSNPR